MSDYKTPKDKLIDPKTALALNLCYKDKQKEGFGEEDEDRFSCSSWYSLEDLEGYINYVKEEASKQKINVDGIRFYFGVYPETEDESLAGRNTLFMCPTKADLTISGERRSGDDDYDDDNGNDSSDVTTISALNYGDAGNPPRNDFGG